MATFTLYLIEETALKGDSLEALVSSVQRDGTLWRRLEFDAPTFAAALERIDQNLGSANFLRNLAFHNPPLGLQPFGYFTPQQVFQLEQTFSAVDCVTMPYVQQPATLDVDDEWYEWVWENTYPAFRTAVGEAASRQLAIAVVHA